MRATILGSGQSMLNAGRAGAAVFLARDEPAPDAAGILLDCGPGSLERAQAAGIGLERVAAVFLSHLHFDHALALAELLTRLAFAGRDPPAVYGPAGTSNYAQSAVEYAQTQLRYLHGGQRLPLLHAVRVEEVAEGEALEVAGLGVESVVVPHSEMLVAQARRVSRGGKTLVYSGDSGPAGEVMTPFAQGADVLVHECYSKAALQRYASQLDEAGARSIKAAFAGSHSEVGSVARIAAAAGVGRLVLTHLLPTEEDDELAAEARREFAGAVVVARDGLVVEV